MLRIVVVSLMAVWSFSCKSSEDSSGLSEDLAVHTSVSVPMINAPSSPVWTYEDLKQFVKTRQIMSIDELVEGLTKTEVGNSLLANSLFVYAGTGDLHSSKQATRVILFTPDASLIVSYAGTISEEEPENLQVSQFRYDTNRFELSEIVFPAATNDDAGDSSQEDFAVQFYDESAHGRGLPDHCVSCHTEDTRPVWDAAPLWPGLYGGLHDAIATGTSEHEALSEFVETAVSFPRYSHLPTLKKWMHTSIETSPTANGYFSEQISKLNFRRITRLLSEGSDHELYKHAILATLLSCDPENPGRLAPAQAEFVRPFAEVLQETRTAISNHYDDKVATLAALDETINTKTMPQTFAGSETEDDIRMIAGLRYLLEERQSAPESMANWSMTFSQSYVFATGDSGIHDLAAHYFVHAFAGDAKVGALHDEVASHAGQLYDDAVKRFRELARRDKAAICRLL